MTWLALEPLTGRTHQLRVHCAEMGWPIVGDAIYGTAPRTGGPVLHLHAREVVVPLYKNRAPIRVGRRRCRRSMGSAALEAISAVAPAKTAHAGDIASDARQQLLSAVVSGDGVTIKDHSPASAGVAQRTLREMLGAAAPSASISTCRVAPTSARDAAVARARRARADAARAP